MDECAFFPTFLSLFVFKGCFIRLVDRKILNLPTEFGDFPLSLLQADLEDATKRLSEVWASRGGFFKIWHSNTIG